MTDDNLLDEIFSHAKLVELVNRAMVDGDTPLEFGMCGMVFMLYPSRIFAVSDKERFKTFIAFVLTLSALSKYGAVEYTLRALMDFNNEQTLEIGVCNNEDSPMIWVPCQIARIDAKIEQPVLILPRVETEPELERAVLIRKIEL